jgi:hypothetical protein
MNFEDIKLYTLSVSTMAISMTQVSDYLKLLLLILSIGYTMHKWIHFKKNKEK